MPSDLPKSLEGIEEWLRARDEQEAPLQPMSESSITCSTPCSEAGYYMSSGSCSNPMNASCTGCDDTCYSYCASTSSDCVVCPDGSYSDGELLGHVELTLEELKDAAPKLRMVGYDNKNCKSYKVVTSALIALLFGLFRAFFHPFRHGNTHRFYFICLPS